MGRRRGRGLEVATRATGRVARAGVAIALLLACGSRTGLLADLGDTFDGDGGPDTGPIVHRDSGRDVDGDGGETDDGDATRNSDVPSSDVAFDQLPPIDVTPRPDVVRNDCPDADATLIYLLSSTNELYSFYPPDFAFKKIGNIACPASASATPFSMAVNRKGVAFSVFTDGNLFRLSTATAACVATSFTIGQSGFTTFGMGFASDTNGPAEKLYVAENSFNANVDSKGLATIDTTTFGLSFISAFSPAIPRAELTGTGDGHLFGFYTNLVGNGSHIVEIDKTSANVVGKVDLTVGEPTDAFAFAFWGGDFYVFTSPSGGSTVTRYRPADGTQVNLGTAPSMIVGAGVSTCAPE